MKVHKPAFAIVVGLVVLQIAVCSPVALGQDGFRAFFDTARNLKRLTRENERPPMPADPCVEQIASEIDWLEHLIETHGTAVAKYPDVWGEARLAQYRADYEREIIKKIDACQFDAGIQASLRRSDTSSLALALALNAAGDKGEANQASAMIGLPIINKDGKIEAPLSGSAKDAVADGSSVKGSDKLGLEPIVQLNQLSDYLNHINALRRRNEGDDTADAPGYALNLLRIPVSVFPGKHTREGYGAETTFTLRPILSDDLLPTTMRDLILNDVVEQNALPLAQVFNNEPENARKWIAGFEANLGRVSRWLLGYDAWLETLNQEAMCHPEVAPTIAYLEGFREYLTFRFLQIAQAANQGDDAEREDAHKPCRFPLPDGSVVVVKWRDIAALLDGLFPQNKSHEADCSTYCYPIASMRATVSGKEVKILVQLMNAGELRDRRMDLAPYGAVELAPGSCFLREVIRSECRKVLLREGSKMPADARKVLADCANQLSEVECLKKLEEATCPGSVRLRDQFDKVRQAIAVEFAAKVKDVTVDVLGLASQAISAALSSEKRESFSPTLVGAMVTSVAEKFRELGESPREFQQFTSDWGTLDAATGYQSQISEALDNLDANAGTAAFSNFLFDRSGDGLTTAGARRERAMSPSQYPLVYGTIAFHRVAVETYFNLRKNPANDRIVHLLDIRQVLRAEAEAAYRLLAPRPGIGGGLPHPGFWRHASPELAHAVRHQEIATIRRARETFFREFSPYNRHMITGSIAWGILVEAALLNERLLEDMQSLAAAKGMMPQVQMAMSFVGPREILAPEAQEAFKAYVAQRWPPIVFALDPSKTEQNVADAFASRRELQLAISVAVANGEMSAGAAGRFMRDLELDVETVALNPTQVAFSHGSDTFGWRFYPRLQTPDTPGNIQAFGESLFGVGPTRKDCFLRQQRLEPGLRECTAVVVMPSFVPYATLECRTNWFALTNPEKKVLTLHDSMRISRAYQSIQQFVHCPADHGQYRPQDVSLLGSALTQLEKRMPLQSMTVGIPYENTLGGFDMFSTGVTGLGPQLDGWYGAPGIRTGEGKSSDSRKVTEQTTCPKDGAPQTAAERSMCDNSGTTIFLVGDRFSPLATKTRVIAGGRCCDFRLLSRQVLEVLVPPDAMPLQLEGKGQPSVIDVHVATPYGPTNHLLIPVVSKPSQPNGDASEKAVKALAERVQLLESNVPNAEWSVDEVAMSATYENCKLTGQCLCEALEIKVGPTNYGASTAAGETPALELRAGNPHFAPGTKTSRDHTLQNRGKGIYPAREAVQKLISELVAKAESPELRCGLQAIAGQVVTFEVEGVLYPTNGDSPITIARPLRVKIISKGTLEPCEGCGTTVDAGYLGVGSAADCPQPVTTAPTAEILPAPSGAASIHVKPKDAGSQLQLTLPPK